MKILVAEDDPIMLKTIQLRLRKDGYEVVCVTDGKEAMKEIETTSPDMIITDIMMPYSSGLEIIAFVKQKITRKIPVIILSAMGQENVVIEAFGLGADDFVAKPFSPNELSVRVRRLESKTNN